LTNTVSDTRSVFCHSNPPSVRAYQRFWLIKISALAPLREGVTAFAARTRKPPLKPYQPAIFMLGTQTPTISRVLNRSAGRRLRQYRGVSPCLSGVFAFRSGEGSQPPQRRQAALILIYTKYFVISTTEGGFEVEKTLRVCAHVLVKYRTHSCGITAH